MTSSASEALSRLMAVRGTNDLPRASTPKPGTATADGADLPPGSMAYPPCRCPRCREAPLKEPTLRATPPPRKRSRKEE